MRPSLPDSRLPGRAVAKQRVRPPNCVFQRRLNFLGPEKIPSLEMLLLLSSWLTLGWATTCDAKPYDLVLNQACSILKSNLPYYDKVGCIDTLLAKANKLTIDQANKDEVLRSFDCFYNQILQFPVPSGISDQVVNDLIDLHSAPDISSNLLAHRGELLKVANFVVTKGLNLASAGEFDWRTLRTLPISLLALNHLV